MLVLALVWMGCTCRTADEDGGRRPARSPKTEKPVRAPVPEAPDIPIGTLEPGQPGNVMVLLIDDAGVDKIGAYGDPIAARTPRIDGLARQGVRFTNAYAAPLCSPTRALLLTGRYGRRTGIGTITERESNGTALPLAAVTIPEALDFATGQTWSNAAIGKWHLAGVDVEGWEKHPNEQGFDTFIGNRGNPEYRDGRRYDVWSRNVNGTVEDAHVYMTTGTVDDALATIPQLQEPFFLYVAFNAPHVPLHTPPAKLVPGGLPKGHDRMAKFDAMLEALDTEIGRLLDSMDPAVLGRTTVVTLGDNGTSSSGVPKNAKLKKQVLKGSVFERGVRIPLIVTGPRVARPGRTEDALVHAVDLMPTVADIAGIPRAEGAPDTLVLGDDRVALDGISWLPLLRGDDGATGHEYIYSELFEPNGAGPYAKDFRGVRNATHKLIRVGTSEQLYRMGDGWWEKRDLLRNAKLSPADETAHAELSARMDALEAELVYEGR